MKRRRPIPVRPSRRPMGHAELAALRQPADVFSFGVLACAVLSSMHGAQCVHRPLASRACRQPLPGPQTSMWCTEGTLGSKRFLGFANDFLCDWVVGNAGGRGGEAGGRAGRQSWGSETAL
jgi:hypothetical protein